MSRKSPGLIIGGVIHDRAHIQSRSYLLMSNGLSDALTTLHRYCEKEAVDICQMMLILRRNYIVYKSWSKGRIV